MYLSERLAVRYFPRASDYCVITFDSFTDIHDLSREAFAEEFLRTRDVSAIHIVNKYNDWYQHGEMEGVLAQIVAQAAQYRRRIVYGSSMGGYAALRYAEQLNADHVISISPQYSMILKNVPFEKRWKPLVRGVRWNKLAYTPLSNCGTATIIFDPMCRHDAEHVYRILEDRDAELVEVPYSGHPSGTYLAEAGLLAPIIEALFVEGDIAEYVKQIRPRREEAASYWMSLAEVGMRRNPERALEIARTGAGRHPNIYYLLNMQAHLLLLNGRYREALEVCERIQELVPDQPAMHQLYARALAANGRFRKAWGVSRLTGKSSLKGSVKPLLSWGTLRMSHLRRRLSKAASGKTGSGKMISGPSRKGPQR